MDWLNKARQFVGNILGGAGRTISNIAGGVARGVGQAEQQAARVAQQAVQNVQRNIPQAPRFQLPQVRIQAPQIQLPQAPKIDFAAVGKALSDYYGKTALSQTTPQNFQKAVSQVDLSKIPKFIESQAVGLRGAIGQSFIPSAGEINPQNIMQYGTEKDKQALQKYLQTGKAGDVAIAPQVTRQGQTIYAPKGLSTAQQIANPLLAGLFWAGLKVPTTAVTPLGKLASGGLSIGTSNAATGAVSRYGETGKVSEALNPKNLAIDFATGTVTGSLFSAPGALKAYKGQKALTTIGNQVKLQDLAKYVNKNAPITVGSLPEKGALRAQGYTNVQVQFQPKPGQVAPTMRGAIPQVAPKPGKIPTPETSLKPLDTFATNKYGKPASKLTPNQLQTVIREYFQVVPAGKEIVNKIGNANTALNYDITRPQLVFGGKLNNVYSNGYVFVSDKKMANTINDYIANKEIKKYVKGLEFNVPVAEKLAQAKKYISELQLENKTKYPKVEKGGEFANKMGLYDIRGNEAKITGYYNSGYHGSIPAAVLSDGKINVEVNPNYLALFNKYYPDATYRITEPMSPVQVIYKNKNIGVIMPLKPGPELPPELSGIGKQISKAPAKMPVQPKTTEQPTQALMLQSKAIEPQANIITNNAKKYQSEFTKSVNEIAGLQNNNAILGPIKSKERILQKAINETGGDLSKVQDINRAVIHINKPEDLNNYISAIRQKFGQETRISNNFSDSTGTYKKIIVNVKTPYGHNAEIQFTTPEMWKAKIEMNGDPMYHKYRSNPDNLARLEQKMKKLYADAELGTANRLNSASAISLPSKALPKGKGFPSDVVDTTLPSAPKVNLTKVPSTLKNRGKFISISPTENVPQITEGVNKPQAKIPLGEVVPPKSSVQTVIDALAEAKPIRGKQEALYSAERAKRAARVAAMGEKVQGEKGFFAQLGQLKGELPKAQFEGIRKQITQPVVDDLFNQIEKSNISVFEKVTAKQGLAKLLGAEGGVVPTRGELSLLNEVFPKELSQAILAKRTVMQKLGSIGGEIINLPRSIQASVDLSGPLRQGALLIGRPKQWIPAFASMFKYAGSEKAYQGLMENIRMRPTYQAMRQSKLALTDMKNPLQGREEAFMSNLAEKIPAIGRVIKGSDRAYTGFINKLRADTFDDLLSKAKQTGAFDNNPQIADDIAKFVNTATGRGNLPGSVERAAVVLNGVFFSPRLMASRIQTLNPVYYVKLDPFVRKEALKSLLTFAGIASSIVGMSKLGGAEVGIDPRSADFGKIKIGDTRYDPYAGFQQYIVLGSRLLTGQMISSTTGKEIRLGEGYKTPNRLDIITRFFQSKESPIASFVTGLLQKQTATGEKFNIPAEVVDRFIPMMANDLYDLYREYGTKGLAMGIPGLFGAGSQTYTDQIPMKGKTASGKENITWRQAPSLGETIVNKVTGTQISNIPKEQWASLQEKKKVETQWGIDLAGIKAKVLSTGESQTAKNPVTGKDIQVYLKDGVVTTKEIKKPIAKKPKVKVSKARRTGGRGRVARAKVTIPKAPRLKAIKVAVPKAPKVSFKQPTPTKARKSIKIKTG